MLRTILFFAWFWLSLLLTFPFLLLYFATLLFGRRALFRNALQALVRLWARSLVAVAGLRVTAEGLDLLPREGRVCIVANHQGNMDIVLALALIERPFGFVVKKEGLFVPFINLWVVALDSVFIDRGNIAEGRKSIARGIAKIGRGHAILVFPEGTRGRGGPVGEFRRGSFKLATRAEALVVPVSIRGTAAAWEERARIAPAEVSFIVHEPLPTAGLSAEERQSLPDRVRAVIVDGR